MPQRPERCCWPDKGVRAPGGDGNFTGVARRVAGRPDDAVLFAGIRPDRAAACARALRDAGHRGARVTGEHVAAGRFLTEAEGWMVGTGYTDAAVDSRTRAFAAAHRDRHGAAPAPTAARPSARNCCAAPGRASPAASASTLVASTFEAAEDGGAFLYRVHDGRARFVLPRGRHRREGVTGAPKAVPIRSGKRPERPHASQHCGADQVTVVGRGRIGAGPRCGRLVVT
ncbi:hypothetical protein ACIHCM_36995 [Streptomyces sp. NPDC052023]|uniref:hypothetical protein n=1 Tax=Streptomyces sp. NPDC052023 TaxID=3365681 RepID=UPI0037D4ABF2